MSSCIVHVLLVVYIAITCTSCLYCNHITCSVILATCDSPCLDLFSSPYLELINLVYIVFIYGHRVLIWSVLLFAKLDHVM